MPTRPLPVRWIGGGAAAVALGVSAFYGGLAPARESGPPAVATGVTVDGARWNVTVTGGRLVSPTTRLSTAHPGDRWLVVVATIEVTSADSRSDIADAVRLTGVDGLLAAAPARVLLSRDGTDVVYLNPGLKEVVGFFWEQAASAPVPESLTVEVYGETLRPDSLGASVHGGNLAWLDPTVTATVTTPVEDRRA